MVTIFSLNTVLGLLGSCVWFLTPSGSYIPAYTVEQAKSSTTSKLKKTSPLLENHRIPNKSNLKLLANYRIPNNQI